MKLDPRFIPPNEDSQAKSGCHSDNCRNNSFIPPVAIDVDDEIVIDLQSIIGSMPTPGEGTFLINVGDMTNRRGWMIVRIARRHLVCLRSDCMTWSDTSLALK